VMLMAQKQICLPLRHTGCGLQSYASVISKVGFFSSVCQALPKIVAMQQQYFPSSALSSIPLFAHMQELMPSISSFGVGDRSIKNAYKDFPASFAELVAMFGSSCPKRLQKRLMKDIGQVSFNSLLTPTDPPTHESLSQSARLRSLSAPESSLWLRLIPDRPQYKIDDWVFSACMRHRLGLQAAENLPSICPCKSKLDSANPAHHQGCKDLIPRAITQRHNLLVRALQRVGHDCGWVVKVEGRNEDGKPDLRFSGGSASIISDVVCVHPLSKSLVALAAKEDGHWAIHRTTEKKTIYTALATKEKAELLPAAFETYGRWGPDVKPLVEMLCRHSGIKGRRDPELLKAAFNTIALAQQVGIAQVYAAGRQHATDPSAARYRRQRFASADSPRRSPSRRRSTSQSPGRAISKSPRRGVSKSPRRAVSQSRRLSLSHSPRQSPRDIYLPQPKPPGRLRQPKSSRCRR
jgi:hypothetical protein